MRAAASVIAALLCGAVHADAVPAAPSTVETRDDGWLIHQPSGILLPREIFGAEYTHRASLKHVAPDGIVLDYGPITVTIGLPQVAADPVMFPAGMKQDPHLPSLPALLFWGDAAQPITVSFLHDGGSDPRDWVSFVIIVEGWQIELSALYPAEARATVLKTAEAVWANLASGNEREPR